MKPWSLDYRGKSLLLVLVLHTAVVYAALRESDYASSRTSVAPISVSLISLSDPAPVVRQRPVVKTMLEPQPVSPNAAAMLPEPMPQPAARMPDVPAQVVPAVYDAAYLDNPRPNYPGLSRRFGEQGTVMLRVWVDIEGRAREVQIQASSGWARLDQSAKDAVARWRFAPARRGDQPISDWVVVPIKFQLTRQG